MEKKMMKCLTVSGIVSISFALALMVGGCGKSEEKKEVHSKSETVTEHAVTEGHEAAATEGHEAAATGHGHEATHDKVREAIQAAHEAATGMHEQASEKVETATDKAEEHTSGAHEAVKGKMLEGC